MDDDTKLAAVAIASPPIIAVLTAIVIMDGSADTALTFVLIIAAAFAALGIYQQSGRGAWLTAGYNTMAPEEKAQYDPRSIARGSGIIMLGTAALAATCIFGTVFLAAGIVILIACIICGIAVMKKTA